MVWAWIDPPSSNDSVWLTLNHSLTTLRTFQCPEKSDLIDSSAYYNASRHTRSIVEAYDCLPVARSERIVSFALKRKQEECLDISQAVHHPVFVQTKSGVVDTFSVVIVMNCLPCVDIKKSNIRSWVVENEFTIDYEGLTFRNDCLMNLDIAADTTTGHIIVSDKLKSALSKTPFKGLYFAQGVELES